MITWNFQYISKTRLAETIGQLMQGRENGDILVRIHTAIHSSDEAVDLARFVKHLIPHAVIMGSSTSAPIGWGHVIHNQCIISISSMSNGHVSEHLFHPGEDTKELRSLSVDDAKLLLCLFAGSGTKALRFTEDVNAYFPGIPVTGGIADISNSSYQKNITSGFIFDETGFFMEGVKVAVIGGDRFDCTGGFSSGIITVDTEARGDALLKDIAPHVESVSGKRLLDMVRFTDDKRRVFGSKIIEDALSAVTGEACSDQSPDREFRIPSDTRMAFMCDTEIIAESRKLFRHIEDFTKTELLFGYSCASRVKMFRGCSAWELSVYESSNISGCVTAGVFSFDGEKAVLTDGAFALTAAGEDIRRQKYNPNVFSHTEELSSDNRSLLSYLMETERVYGNTASDEDKKENADTMPDSLRQFINVCESILFKNDDTGLLNSAALSMDMNLNGYDRVCMIDVLDVHGMKAIFPEGVVKMTEGSYISKCLSFARRRDYRVYRIVEWQLAVAAPSYMVRLSEFIADMEKLQRELFRTQDGTVTIVPTMCIMDDCDPEALYTEYNSARNRMIRKNLQFYIHDTVVDRTDEKEIRARYDIVDVMPTFAPKDATKLADACCNNYDTIVVAGGDGTLNEVVNAIANKEHRPRLGYIPCGTTNDVAHSLKIPKNINRALNLILSEETVSRDIFKINDQYGIYVGAFGMCTQTSYKTKQKTKRLFGRLAYFFEGIREFGHAKSFSIKLETEKQTIETKIVLGIIVNNKYVGGFRVDRHADLKDGFASLILIKDHKRHGVSIRALMKIARIFLFGTPKVTSGKKYEILKVDKAKIDLPENIDINIDGEWAQRGSFEFEVLKEHIQIFAEDKNETRKSK